MRGKRVLVVDDDPRILDSVTRMLGEEGAEVQATDKPETVVEKARESRPDLILLDVRMPGMSGYDVARQLREDPATMSIPVVLMTAKAITFQMPVSLLRELAGVINKPFSKYQLVDGLRAALKKRSSGSEA